MTGFGSLPINSSIEDIPPLHFFSIGATNGRGSKSNTLELSGAERRGVFGPISSNDLVSSADASSKITRLFGYSIILMM
jgi:hypothetical protein